jgi:PBP1b-binding outer membrane lipoprotein LpoB
MKNKIIISTAIAAVLFTACSSSNDSSDTVVETTVDTTVVETTVPETTTTEAQADPETQFIDDIMYEYSWVVNNMGRVTLVELGKTVCAAIDEGMSFNGYLDMMLNADVDLGAGGAILRSSIVNFCPQEQWFLDAAIDELSRG